MNKTILLLSIPLLLNACSDADETPDETRLPLNTETKTVVERTAFHTYYASYVGDFEADPNKINNTSNATFVNKINITLNSLEDGKVRGRSIIAGNDRPFEGSYRQNGKLFTINANEPGDDPHDGRFEFTLDTVNQELAGKWYCNDPAIAVPVRLFKLSKMDFHYNPENRLDDRIVGAAFYGNREREDESYEAVTGAVLQINASTTKLSKHDIENLYKGDLEIIRNAIYARHGYSFRNRRMRYMFDNFVSWYIPFTVDVRAVLTPLEKENIDLLKRYENHAEKYYDEFSR